MARKRNPNRDKAKQKWLESKGSVALVDIAFELDVTPSTVRKWKAQDKWDDELKGSAPIEKGSVAIQARGSPGAPLGNKNALGNVGGGAPVGNSNAVTHGFFQKFLPAETREIVDYMDESGIGPIDMLWMSIQTKFAAITRAQQLMLVRDQEDKTTSLTKIKGGMKTDGEGNLINVAFAEELQFENQYAWDKQAKFMNAFARASSELRALIKDFLILSGQDDLRRKQLEKIQHDMEISAAHLEIANRKNPEETEDEYEDDGFLDALGGATKEVWDEET